MVSGSIGMMLKSAPDGSHSFDLICITGDLVDLDGCRTLSQQVDEAICHIRSLRSTLVAVCSGNHDSLPYNHGRFRRAR